MTILERDTKPFLAVDTVKRQVDSGTYQVWRQFGRRTEEGRLEYRNLSGYAYEQEGGTYDLDILHGPEVEAHFGLTLSQVWEVFEAFKPERLFT